MTGRITKQEKEMSIKMAEIKTDIHYIKSALDDNKEDHKKIYDLIENWIRDSESKFASKWVEKGLITFIISLLIVLISLGIRLLLKSSL